MKRKLFVLLALVGLLALAIPATTNAGRGSVRADMELDFNAGFGNPDSVPPSVAPDVTWVGTLDFGGDVYGIAFFSTAPLKTLGDWVYFEENVEIYASPGFEFTDGVLTTFDPGPIVLEMHDRGWGNSTIGSGIGFAFGRVDIVHPDNDPHGLFDESVAGNPFFWRGAYGATPAEFDGPFWIYGVNNR